MPIGRTRNRPSTRRRCAGIETVLVTSKHLGPAATADRQRCHRITTLAHQLDLKEGYPPDHATAVVANARAIADELGLAEDVRLTLDLGAELHDLGKLCIRDSVLAKPTALTEEEWDVMRIHPEAGAWLFMSLVGAPEVAAIIRFHHERWDGSGYPTGLAGEAIPLAARIVAVGDAYQAMVEPRPYRQAFSHTVALERLHGGSGTQFDPACVDALSRALQATRTPRAD
jgi:HD-GYP domain-containing protein (c-di-GMP phosphodiesterase class II)